MELKDIKKIIQMMKDNDLSEFEMEDQGSRISIKRQGAGEQPAVVVQAPAAAPVMVSAPVAVPGPQAAGGEASVSANEGLVEVKSPMVGTFYRAASPDAEALVSVGDEIDEDTVVAIIEAMKVMNEIKAEVRGVVRSIVVENATSVEFDQALFLVEPL